MFIDAHRGEVDEQSRRLVVRNGFHEAREVTTAAGAVPVRQPRVNDKRIDEVCGERKGSLAILQAWARKSPRVAEVLPLQEFPGSHAGPWAATITRLITQWQDEARGSKSRSLAGSD